MPKNASHFYNSAWQAVIDSNDWQNAEEFHKTFIYQLTAYLEATEELNAFIPLPNYSELQVPEFLKENLTPIAS